MWQRTRKVTSASWKKYSELRLTVDVLLVVEWAGGIVQIMWVGLGGAGMMILSEMSITVRRFYVLPDNSSNSNSHAEISEEDRSPLPIRG